MAAIRNLQTPRSLRQRAVQRWQEEGRRLLVPLMGYPGLNLNRTTIKQNQFNHAVQYQTVSRLYDRFHPHGMLFLMDLSVEASALGLSVRFPLDETPTVDAHPVRSPSDLELFHNIDLLSDGRVMVYLEVLRHMRAALPVPVGAYITGPFTLAGLMMGASDLALATMLDPSFCREVLELALHKILGYARALVAAGADFLMILDPTAVMLGPRQFAEFAGVYVREIVGLLHEVEMILHVCGNTEHLLGAMADTGVVGLSLDSCVDMPRACSLVPPGTLMLGNLDPVTMLRATPPEIAAATTALLDSVADYPDFILSTGCDLPQDVPLDNIQAFMDAGRQWRAAAQRLPA